MKRLFLLAVAAFCAGPAAADEILLTNGRTIQGLRRTDQHLPGKVVVEVGSGTLILDEREVSSVKEGRSPLHDYQDRWEKVKDSDKAGDYWSLARWAKEKKLTRYLRPLAEKVIELEPDHEGARAQLRHEKLHGRWMTFEEAKEAKGFIKRGGRWITAAELERIEQRKLQDKERRLLAKLERERRQDEERERRQRAIEDYRDWLARESQLPFGYMYRPSWFWPAYYRPYPWTPYKYKLPPNGYRGGYGGALPTFDVLKLFRPFYPGTSFP